MSELCPLGGTSGSLSMGSYQRHYYRLGAPVREIVRRGQDTLSRLHVCRVNRLLSYYYSPPVTQYPQSLGELCLEIAQDGWSHYVQTGDVPDPPVTRRDIQELRRTLYRKHTDHWEERQTARAERLIDAIWRV